MNGVSAFTEFKQWVVFNHKQHLTLEDLGAFDPATHTAFKIDGWIYGPVDRNDVPEDMESLLCDLSKVTERKQVNEESPSN
jgi:hypothetical protein